MAKKIKLKLTGLQFIATIDMVDTISSMRGEGDEFTAQQSRNIMLFDRMLKKNGYKRKLN